MYAQELVSLTKIMCKITKYIIPFACKLSSKLKTNHFKIKNT